MVNFYELLNIHNTASEEEILKAYKTQAKLYHPDANAGSLAATTMFQMLTLAKDTLLAESKRLEHDYAMGVKIRPVPQPKIIREVVHVPMQRENNIDQKIGLGLLGVIVGMAIAGSDKK